MSKFWKISISIINDAKCGNIECIFKQLEQLC